MIVGYHVVFGAYGLWLPNDPRGSWSDLVASLELYLAGGPATKTSERRSLARDLHDREKRLAAKSALRFPPVKFSGRQIETVGSGFAEYFQTTNCRVWACSIMPDHVHMVVGRAHIPAEKLVVQLKAAATRELLSENCHPFQNCPDKRGGIPNCFVRGQWIVYLDDDDMARCIRYVEQNPVKQRMALQQWGFVERQHPW
jgi:REP-associated tyrosine transposase